MNPGGLTLTFVDTPGAPSAIQRTAIILDRALKMDSSALVKLRIVAENSLDLFLSTPLNVIAMQRIPGTIAKNCDGAVVMASDIRESMEKLPLHVDSPRIGNTVSLSTVNLMWPGSLPPLEGYELLDKVPAQVFRQLHEEMRQQNKEHAGPLGMPRSLLEQKLLTVEADLEQENGTYAEKHSIHIDGRMVAAIGGLGVAVQPQKEELKKYDFLRVSTHSSWIRIDALFGSVFTPKPGGLARVP